MWNTHKDHMRLQRLFGYNRKISRGEGLDHKMGASLRLPMRWKEIVTLSPWLSYQSGFRPPAGHSQSAMLPAMQG
jgi:hypothetical protein